MPRIRTAAALAAAAALLFTGCASSSSPASTDSAAADDTFPITITHALGETTIPSKPERVAAVGWSNQDVALALGVGRSSVSRALSKPE